MNELERFAAAVLAQWRADGGADGGPISVAALMDRVLPYRIARRLLGIDISEDYEAMVLRLIAEEDQLVTTEPLDAAEMAKATISSKLPDLDVLQLLRAATITITRQALSRLDGVLPMPTGKDDTRWAPDAGRGDAGEHASDRTSSEDVIPLHPAPSPGAPSGPAAKPPEEFLTTVSFTPPVSLACWSCTEALPADREVKFCPFCGADQRAPVCRACGAPVERRWKHCAECGAAVHAG